MDHQRNLTEIFLSAVDAVKPANLIRNSVKLENNVLCIKNKTIKLTKPCHLVGFGKAVFGMALEMERILGPGLGRGILTIPEGFLDSTQMLDKTKMSKKLEFIEGAKDNLPDLNAMRGARQIAILCESLQKDDVLIVLISGGGSSLLPLPRAGIALHEKQQLAKELFNRGASISEVNSVRKRMSELKGGRLAAKALPATVIALILSDVIGDPVDFIASGPTVRSADAPSLALEILDKYDLIGEMSQDALGILRRTNDDADVDWNGFDKNVSNFVIGSNEIACERAKECAQRLGYESLVLSTRVSGHVDQVAEMYCQIVEGLNKGDLFMQQRNFACDLNFKAFPEEFSGRPLCLIAGGEPTIRVRNPKGLGGRNQHLALKLGSLLRDRSLLLKNRSASKKHSTAKNYPSLKNDSSLKDNSSLKDDSSIKGDFPIKENSSSLECSVPNKGKVYFLSAGTDGIDGPTPAAGAICNDNFLDDFPFDVEKFLDENNSYEFYRMHQNGQFLVQTGHTGTNVMDIHVLIVDNN